MRRGIVLGKESALGAWGRVAGVTPPLGLTKFQSILNFPLFLLIQISLTISLCVKISLVQINFLPLFC
jgi:hypothetical protein